MENKPPFDMVRATFYLVAGVFAIYGLAAIGTIAVCIMGATTCPDGKLSEVFITLLTSALAYSAGQGTKK